MAKAPDRERQGEDDGNRDNAPSGQEDPDQERRQAATTRPEAAADDLTIETVPVVVHPRKTVHYDARVGTRIHPLTGKRVPVFAPRVGRPGTVIHVTPQDAEFLRAHGFTHDPADPTAGPATQATVPSALPPQGPTINGEDGTVLRAGS